MERDSDVRIFVSHSHEDHPFCQRLVADLRARLGDDAVWYDASGGQQAGNGLQGGNSWWPKIMEEISACPYFLVVLSPHASASNWVREEMGIAFRQKVESGKRLLPVRLEDSPRGEDWKGIQEFDFTAAQPYEQALTALLRALGVDPATTARTASEPANDPWRTFQSRRQRLLAALNEQAAILTRLGRRADADSMRRLAVEAASDFKVIMVGEFNRGKSTLINALIGQKILPTHIIPTTAIPTEVKWGKQPVAYLHAIKKPGEARQRIEAIPVDDLDRYTVPAMEEHGDDEPDTRYEKIVVEWPLDALRDGIELVDTPGLNTSNHSEQIVMAYMAIADIVVVVLSVDFLLSNYALNMIADIRATLLSRQGSDNIFFVCNHMDVVEEERPRVVRRLTSILSPLTSAGARHISFVSARDALLAHDTHAVEQSGIPQVERDLKDFLATARGTVKLAGPAQALRESVEATRARIVDNQAFRELGSQLDRQSAIATELLAESSR